MNRLCLMVAVACLVACGGDDSEDTLVSTDDGITDSDDPGGGGYEVELNETQVGSPAWGIVGAELFVAPMNAETAKCVLEPNHRYDLGVWLPSSIHAEPFDDEFGDAIDGCGFEFKSTISSEDFTSPSGIFLALIVEGSGSGSTPDYESGGYIPADKFPMVIDGDVRRDLVIVDGDQDRTYPDPISLGYNVDGHSHVPLLFQMNLERMPAGATPPGDYTFRLSIRDASAAVSEAGWDIEVPFTVE